MAWIRITPDGAVVLEVDVNRDSVGQLTTAGYAINTKHVKTQVRVQDGGTVVLGGIYEDADKSDEAKVPSLGDVPLVGWLFRNRQQTRRKSELLVFLTPRVMADSTPAVEMVGPVAGAPDPLPDLRPAMPEGAEGERPRRVLTGLARQDATKVWPRCHVEYTCSSGAQAFDGPPDACFSRVRLS